MSLSLVLTTSPLVVMEESQMGEEGQRDGD